MQPDNFRNLVEYMCDMRRRNRNNYGSRKLTALDTKIKNNTSGDQRNRSRDGRRSQDHQG